jgi:hypothetical protein
LSQTICGKPNGWRSFGFGAPHPFYLDTNNIFNRASSILVKILNNYLGNPQITKTCLNSDKNFNVLKYKLFIMPVGISETTRLLFTNIIIQLSTFVNGRKFSNSSDAPKGPQRSDAHLIQTISDYSADANKNKESDKPFYEWLAGLIDGDGYF